MLPYKTQICKLTSCYGYRTHPIKGWRHFHGGIDLVGIGGNEIVAVTDGTVVRSRIVTNKADATWEWGEYIAIAGTDGKTVYYCHLSKRLVSVGEKVKAGDVIGIQGRTGQATGDHLHFEVRAGSKQIDAAEYISIKNAAGAYDGVKVAIDKFVVAKVIDSPAYWYDHHRDLPYLAEFIVKCADKVKKGGVPCKDLKTALDRLVAVGAINSPDYWMNNAGEVPYLTEFICKVGGAV